MEESMLHIPRRIYREYITAHRELTFVYGQDYERKGTFGQAWSAAGEPNTYPISTCRKMCRNSRYWTDGEFNNVCSIISSDIANVPLNKPIIIFPKIGEGGSRMKELAPRLYQYMISELKKIQYKNIIYV